MHVVVISDTHLGWEKTNEEELRNFLDTEIRQISPDKLVLAGDIAELWRQSMTSALLEYSDVFKTLAELHEDVVDVVPLGGNHDWRLMESNAEGKAIANAPWQFQEEFYFESGGRKFVVVHGHQGDTANKSDTQNEAMCLTSDETSHLMATLWERITSGSLAVNTMSSSAPLFQRPNATAFNHLTNPGTLAEPENKSRADRITDRLIAMYDEFVIFGHTHRPQIDEEHANSGSWAGPRNTYVEVKDGEVQLKDY